MIACMKLCTKLNLTRGMWHEIQRWELEAWEHNRDAVDDGVA